VDGEELMPATSTRRILLGKNAGLSSRQKIYRTPEYVETEEAEGYDVTRRRVWLDEVLLVTYHQEVGWAFVAVMLVMMTFFGFLGLLLMLADRWWSIGFLAVGFLPFAAALVLRLVYKVDVVTVYGRRTKAELQFWFRKARARQVHQQITRLVRERQQKLRAARPAPPRPAAAPTVPPEMMPPVAPEGT
jgi:hypothetical protein